jgi:limonene-1,2-epoxide hydrolase
VKQVAPRGNFTAEQLALVRRQISMWENNADDVGAAQDWYVDGELTAPSGVRVMAADIAATIEGWHEVLTDLHVELTALFGSPDGKWLAIEWSWECTRRRDGARSVTPDAIIVELRDGRIASWREYFDTFGSIEFE